MQLSEQERLLREFSCGMCHNVLTLPLHLTQLPVQLRDPRRIDA